MSAIVLLKNITNILAFLSPFLFFNYKEELSMYFFQSNWRKLRNSRPIFFYMDMNQIRNRILRNMGLWKKYFSFFDEFLIPFEYIISDVKV